MTNQTGLGEVLLRSADVVAKTGMSRQTIYTHMAERGFPRPLKPTERMALWKLSEVDAWIEKHTAIRDGAAV